MENKKEITIIDLENNYYCLDNNFIQIYKDNIWQYIYIDYNEKEYEEIYMNCFEYYPQLRHLQTYKKYLYPFQIILKYDNPIIYQNNKYHNRRCLFNLFLNSLTYYIINYNNEKFNDYFNILKNNIICTMVREYNKDYDINYKYKLKNKITIDKIYFNKNILNDLYNLNLGIKFNFNNINCNPIINRINVYKYNSVYVLENNYLILFSKNNKNKNEYMINKVKVINNGETKSSFIKLNEKFLGNIYFENIIIDFPDQTQLIQKNIKLPSTLSPINILPPKSLSSNPSIPSKHSSDLSSDTSTLSPKENNKENNEKIKLKDIKTLKINKPIKSVNYKNKLLIGTIGNTLDTSSYSSIIDKNISTSSSSSSSSSISSNSSNSYNSSNSSNNIIKNNLIEDINDIIINDDIKKDEDIKENINEDEEIKEEIKEEIEDDIDINEDKDIKENIKEEKEDDINKHKIDEIIEEDIIYEDKKEEEIYKKEEMINDIKKKIKELEDLINKL